MTKLCEVALTLRHGVTMTSVRSTTVYFLSSVPKRMRNRIAAREGIVLVSTCKAENAAMEFWPEHFRGRTVAWWRCELYGPPDPLTHGETPRVRVEADHRAAAFLLVANEIDPSLSFSLVEVGS